MQTIGTTKVGGASAWVPWVCIPFLLLFNLQFYTFYFVSFNFVLLHIPAMLALTYRYGRHGFAAALIGSGPLLISIESDYIYLGGHPSLYLIIIHIGWLTLSKSWVNKEKSALSNSAFMTLLLLACSIDLYYGDSDTFSFNWQGIVLLYYVFFLLGLRGVQISRWLLIAGFLLLIGLILPIILPTDFPPIDYLYINLTMNRLGYFLTLLMFFWSGKWIRTTVITAAPSAELLSSGFKLAMFSGILYLLDPMWQGLFAAVSTTTVITETLHAISPVGSYYLLPLLAMLLSITRRNGMLISIALVATYYTLDKIAALSSAGISFNISLTDFAIAIIFSMLGTRIARHIRDINSSASASLFPSATAIRKSTLKPQDWERQHDEISNTVRRVMLSLLAYALFCGITLASTNDASLFGVGSEIELPIAGTSIDYSTFLTVGPLILIGLIVYLHLFLQSGVDLGRTQDASPLPYLFNMQNPLAIMVSSFLHYWLPVLLLFQFAWKATPQPMAGFWLGLLSISAGIVMAYLHLARTSTESGAIPRQLNRVIFFVFALLFAIQMASGGAMLKRTLMLDGAQFENRDLRGFDFRDASLKEANLKNTKLSGANFSGANLNGADFTGADLKNVNFRNALLEHVNLNKLLLNGSDLGGANIFNTQFASANLTDVNFRKASSEEKTPKESNLKESDLRGSDITTAQFADAILKGADLRDMIGMSCDKLAGATNLDKAYRDKALTCGKAIPDPPKDNPERITIK